jgi:hypothetical protein
MREHPKRGYEIDNRGLLGERRGGLSEVMRPPHKRKGAGRPEHTRPMQSALETTDAKKSKCGGRKEGWEGTRGSEIIVQLWCEMVRNKK